MSRETKRMKRAIDIPAPLPGAARYYVRDSPSKSRDYDIWMEPTDGHPASIIGTKGNEQAALRYAIRYQKNENKGVAK